MIKHKMLLRKLIGDNRITIICGAFGTGKTEISVNIAQALAAINEKQVYLVDLDIVNLYFRSRDKRENLLAKGINVISSAAGLENADLPALSPEIHKVFANKNAFVVFDLGGSDYGGTVLARFYNYLNNEKINFWLVVNPFRPFNRKNEDTVAMAKLIGNNARRKINGLIANPHIMNETTHSDIKKGLEQIKQIKEYPLKFLTVSENLYFDGIENEYNIPVLPLLKNMVQPWEL